MFSEEIRDVIIEGKLNMITGVVEGALAAGISSDEILDTMIAAMDEVGDNFQNNDIYVPEMLISAKTMERGVSILKSKFTLHNDKRYGKIIIGTVFGDLHDIGKNLVSIMLQSAGFEVIDLGIDVLPEDFVKAIKANPDCKVVAISALLTFTMDSMKNTVDVIRKTAAGKKVKIMVGGAPITQEFADQIGADAYSKDAVGAVKVARELYQNL